MLEWQKRKNLTNPRGKLFLAYTPGYPLAVADWQCGRGMRDVRTGETLADVVLVAEINLPREIDRFLRDE